MDRGKPWNREMLMHHGTTDSEEKLNLKIDAVFREKRLNLFGSCW